MSSEARRLRLDIMDVKNDLGTRTVRVGPCCTMKDGLPQWASFVNKGLRWYQSMLKVIQQVESRVLTVDEAATIKL